MELPKSGLTTAATIKITALSAGAAREVMTCLAAEFFRQTGNEVLFTFAPVGAIAMKVAGGETADIVVVSEQAMEKLVRQGKVLTETVVELGRVGVGVAVRDGVQVPDISTAEAFRQTLLAAASLVYADPAKGASSGIHFAVLLDKLGIAEAVKKKSILLPGGYAIMELVAEGKAELGIQQITEILPVKGVKLAGPLPPALQKITTYAAGIMTAAVKPDIAASFVAFATGPAAEQSFSAAGFDKCQ